MQAGAREEAAAEEQDARPVVRAVDVRQDVGRADIEEAPGGEAEQSRLGAAQAREARPARERAERRQASLVSAGFPAQLVPSGNGQSRWWIDVRSKVAAAALQGTAGATRQRSLDCAALR